VAGISPSAIPPDVVTPGSPATPPFWWIGESRSPASPPIYRTVRCPPHGAYLGRRTEARLATDRRSLKAGWATRPLPAPGRIIRGDRRGCVTTGVSDQAAISRAPPNAPVDHADMALRLDTSNSSALALQPSTAEATTRRSHATQPSSAGFHWTRWAPTARRDRAARPARRGGPAAARRTASLAVPSRGTITSPRRVAVAAALGHELVRRASGGERQNSLRPHEPPQVNTCD
jgi:hypothetical protein